MKRGTAVSDNRLVAPRGLIAKGNSSITGNLEITGNVTADEFIGRLAEFPPNIISSSAQFGVSDDVEFGAVTSSDLNLAGSILIPNVGGNDTITIGTAGVSHAYLNTPESMYINIDSDNTNTQNIFVVGKDRAGGAGGTDLFVIQEDGKVKIGTKFMVLSNGGIANYQSNDSDLSDVRLKKVYGPTDSKWDVVKGLKLVNYRYLNDLTTRIMVGVTAQQVEEVAPDLFSENGWGDEKHHAVHNKDLYMYGIKALQEAMDRIENLEEELKKLKEQTLNNETGNRSE